MATIREDIIPLLISAKMATLWHLKGCPEAEVESIEKLLGIRLPLAYREFLLTMGHGAGELLKGTDAFYGRLSELREYAEELLSEDNTGFKLPNDSFVFAVHQGYDFFFFYLSEAIEDPPVYEYFEGWMTPRMIAPSFTEYLMILIKDTAEFVKRFPG